MITRDEVYKIGAITKTHGIGGELNMSIIDDIFDRVDAEYLLCDMEGIFVPFFIESYRFRNDMVVLIKFEDVDNENDARRMVGTEVFFPKTMVTEVEGMPAWDYFVGFAIIETEKGTIGEVKRVDDSTANVLFEIVMDRGGECLIPVNEDLITDIDHQHKRIYMTLPEGLLSMNDVE